VGLRTCMMRLCRGAFLIAAGLPLLAIGQQLTPAEVYARVSPSVFSVLVFDANGRLAVTGSAVVVAHGRAVTNKHVVDGGALIRLGRGAAEWEAEVSAVDDTHDLAVLTVNGSAPPRCSCVDLMRLLLASTYMR